MKKEKKIVLIILIILLVMMIIGITLKFVLVKNKPVDIKLVNVNKYNAKLYVPSNAKLKESTNNSAVFETLSSVRVLEDKIDEILKTYEHSLCNYDDVYYDNGNDIKVFSFEIEKGFIYNTFTVNFSYGGDYYGYCEKVTDYTRFKYYTEKVGSYDKTKTIKYSYLNKENEKKELYMYGDFDLFVRRGRGEYGKFQDELRAGYISVPGFISFLEYQVDNKKASLKEYDAGIIYNIEGINVLKCASKSERVIISNQILEYKDEYCDDIFPSSWKWEDSSVKK